MPPSPRIVVVGSLNIDHTLRVDRIPAPGETVTARDSSTRYGGKGANQALAASHLGAPVCLIGCIGNDNEGSRYKAHLQKSGIDTQGISCILDNNTPTGSAFIAVDASGENTIIVNPGANHCLTPELIDQQVALFARSDAALLQLECPLDAVQRAAKIARDHDTLIVINPSPWNDAFLEARIACDILILNEREAASLTGIDPFEPNTLAKPLLETTAAKTLVVTRGARSTLALDSTGTFFEILPPKVKTVDTVGAGDAFAGALTVALAEGQTLSDAIHFANTAGALATQQSGAQIALPTREAIEARIACSERFQ